MSERRAALRNCVTSAALAKDLRDGGRSNSIVASIAPNSTSPGNRARASESSRGADHAHRHPRLGHAGAAPLAFSGTVQDANQSCKSVLVGLIQVNRLICG